jgi:hypothetical protein
MGCLRNSDEARGKANGLPRPRATGPHREAFKVGRKFSITQTSVELPPASKAILRPSGLMLREEIPSIESPSFRRLPFWALTSQSSTFCCLELVLTFPKTISLPSRVQASVLNTYT